MIKEDNINRFNKDVVKLGGYVYTKNNKFSSLVANKHQTNITLSLVKLKDKNIIDVGCGDGTYTQEWYKFGKPKSILGLDPSKSAIKSAKISNIYKNHVEYKVGNIYKLPQNTRYDIAIVRGVLHHLYQPEIAMIELSKVAKKVILIEPNGYNLILKAIEIFSTYHRQHEEKSYAPHKINSWITKNGGKIIKHKYAAIVPFFSPDWLVKILLKIEPFIERSSLLRWFFCSNYYVVYLNP